MIISFDLQPALKKHITGIGYCTQGWVNRFIKEFPQNTYLLRYFSNGGKITLNEMQETSSPNIFQSICHWPSDRICKLIWSAVPVPYHCFFHEKADISFFFNYFIPPHVSGKKVVVIHDMAYKAYPKTVRLRTKGMLNLNINRTCKRADHIITISQFSKEEIVKYLNISPDKISIVSPAFDPKIYNTSKETYFDEVLRKFFIPQDYLLYLGTLEPRKNIVRLLQAYAKLKTKFIELPPLVLAGGSGWKFKPIFDMLDEKELKKSVIVTGYISNDEAVCLLKGAKAFLFPSIYEGFGMPPLEAMACGIPVLTSSRTSLPDVVGDAAVLVDPFSIKEISEGIERIVYDNNLRDELRMKGLKQCEKFSWDIAAKQLYRICQNIIV